MRSKLLGAVSAGGFSFAHLLSGGAAGKGKSKEKDLREDDQTDEDGQDEEEEDEGENAENGGQGGNSQGAEDEGDEEEASAGEADGDEDDDEDEGEEEDEEDAETTGKKGTGKKGAGKKAAVPQPRQAKASAKKASADYKRGRKAERARVGRIMSHPSAANNMALACNLAANTGMSSAAAIALLEKTPAARGGRLDNRMGGQKIPDVQGGGSQPSGSTSIQNSWDHAFKNM